jgi:hypothetical protein
MMMTIEIEILQKLVLMEIADLLAALQLHLPPGE